MDDRMDDLAKYREMWGIKPKGTVYARLVPPADSFEAAHPDSWYPVWYRVVGDWGDTVAISEAEAKAHFEALGKPMPEPTV